MKIFIGSSSHYIRLTDDKSNIDQKKTKLESPLSPIIKFLKIKHIVEPWWVNGVLPKGDDLLDSLILKSQSCDAGIFVLRPDDLLKPENIKETTPIELGVPRGNVLLECGMFLGAQGKSRTFILRDGDFRKIKIPSDISAILCAQLTDKDINSQLDKFFNNEKLRIENKKTKFYLNNYHTDNILKQKYKNWRTKALYIGSTSARLWESFEKETSNEKKTLIDRSEVKKFVEKINQSKNPQIDYTQINNVISLGPGCGKFDNEIVTEVFSKNNSLKYIPIDINPYYAYKASECVKMQSPKIRIPFAIIDDFEENSDYVSDLLKNKFHDLNQSCLFLMIGGTFSNLEGGEKNIIAKINSWMVKSSYLLIDVFIKPKNYKFSTDTKRQVSELMENQFYKEFIINSIEKRHLIDKEDCLKLKEIKDNLSNFLIGNEIEGINEYTQIKSTSVVTYDLKLPDKEPKVIFVAKRYDFNDIKEFLENHFSILEQFNGLIEGEPNKLKDGKLYKSERGIFLLQKK